MRVRASWPPSATTRTAAPPHSTRARRGAMAARPLSTRPAARPCVRWIITAPQEACSHSCAPRAVTAPSRASRPRTSAQCASPAVRCPRLDFCPPTRALTWWALTWALTWALASRAPDPLISLLASHEVSSPALLHAAVPQTFASRGRRCAAGATRTMRTRRAPTRMRAAPAPPSARATKPPTRAPTASAPSTTSRPPLSLPPPARRQTAAPPTRRATAARWGRRRTSSA